LEKKRKQHRDRLVVLSFISVLLVLVYGPASQWFLGADRFLFDQFATHLPNTPVQSGVIISINPAKKSTDEVIAEYGRILAVLREQPVTRIIISQAPPMDELPGWAATLSSGVPVFAPADHRLADMVAKSGILDVTPDADGVLRQIRLWHLRGGIMTPSLPLSVALHDKDYVADSRISNADSAIYLTNYSPIARLDTEDVLSPDFEGGVLAGKTVFVDSEPPLVGATAVLPSQQFVTHSEIIASALANIEQRQIVTAPTWVRALEWATPVLLAVVAILLMVGRKRKDILIIISAVILGLIVVEALFLLIGRMRLDLGRPVLVFLGTGILSWWLAGGDKKAAVNALKRGNDFLAAGRLEPAFAEFRRCEPTETLANAMYKLSLAFEEQSKPERAEAVLQWLKRTHSGSGTQSPFSLQSTIGKSRRLGRYVIEKKIGKGAMGAVYLARDPRINRPVALKVIPIEK
jgi:serine/threonine-protein kinase